MVEHVGADEGAESVPPLGSEVGPDPEPDQAWKALGLVNDWIKHAEAKVGATLAASGGVGVMLFNLVKNQNDPGIWLSLAAVACSAAILAAGSAATLALIPRLAIVGKRKLKKAQMAANRTVDGATDVLEDPVNLLFFSNIAKRYRDDAPSYVEVLRSITANPEELTRQIAHQVHANATVAHRKFTWADRAVRSFAAALALLGIVAIIVGLEG